MVGKVKTRTASPTAGRFGPNVSEAVNILGTGLGKMGGKVLIVDDVATNRIVMKVKMTAAGYLPELAGDGKTCLAMAKASPPI